MQINPLLILIIICLVGGVVVNLYATVMVIIESRAQTVVEELNAEATHDKNIETLFAWEYSTNLTDENFKKKSAAEAKGSRHRKQASERVRKLPWRLFSNYSLKRQLEFYERLGTDALPEEKYLLRNQIVATMENIYSTATICPKSGDNCTLGLTPEITEILETSKDVDELEHVWVKWRDAVGPKCRSLYKEYVVLSNEAAKLNGYKDMSEMLLSEYEDDDFKNKIEILWDQVKPLYVQLHAYIRTKLKEKYGNIVNSDGPIPAHLLGNMWAQSWVSVADFSLPYPGIKDDTDLTDRLRKQNYTVLKIFKTAEDFFISINHSKLSDTFWSKSVLVKLPNVDMVCHASAWDFYNDNDFRIKQCTEVTGRDFVTAHHEMGHIEYYMAYKDQPFPFRGGANDGFHEAVGDLIALSVQSTKHMKNIGLYDSASNPEALLNNLFRIGLSKIAFLPFGYLTDLWRWDVFSGRTKFEEYNCKWWELKHQYQGVEPPTTRSEKDFDPASKYHIVADVPYLRYFISFIIQYQLHEALCKIAGEYDGNNPDKPLYECDIYGNKKAGTLLKKMLAMGSSRPWPDALEVVTGKREMDASGLLGYFEPLHKWLIKENNRNRAFIGWKPSKKVCTSDTG